MADPAIIAASITGTATIIAAIVGALIKYDKLIVTDQFRWRRFFRRGVVILINGGSGTGKTTLAWALARKFNIVSVFGTDLLRESIRFYKREMGTEPEDPIFKSSFETGERFTDQCEDIKGPLLAIMQRIRKKREPVIIEGVNIMASQVFSKIPTDALNGVFFINLHIDNEETHKRRLRDRGITSHEASHETDRYITNIDAVRGIDQLLQDDTEKFVGKSAFVVSVENSGSVSETVDLIERRIRKFMETNEAQ